MKKNEEHRELWDTTKRTSTHILRVSGKERKEHKVYLKKSWLKSSQI